MSVGCACYYVRDEIHVGLSQRINVALLTATGLRVRIAMTASNDRISHILKE
jgi:hypothetical protein